MLKEIKMWDLVRRYSLWANDLQVGFANVDVEQGIKMAIAADKDSNDAEMERAWRASRKPFYFQYRPVWGFLLPFQVFLTSTWTEVSILKRFSSVSPCCWRLTCPQSAPPFTSMFFDTNKDGELNSTEIMQLFNADWNQALAVVRPNLNSLSLTHFFFRCQLNLTLILM